MVEEDSPRHKLTSPLPIYCEGQVKGRATAEIVIGVLSAFEISSSLGEEEESGRRAVIVSPSLTTTLGASSPAGSTAIHRAKEELLSPVAGSRTRRGVAHHNRLWRSKPKCIIHHPRRSRRGPAE